MHVHLRVAFSLVRVLVGLQGIRLRLTNLLFSHRTLGFWVLDTIEIGLLVAVLLYIIVRARGPKFRFYVVLRLQLFSMLALASALLYKHFTRRTRHVHIRHDWRLLHQAMAQLAQAIMLILSDRFPFWLTEFIVTLSNLLIAITSGHELLQSS